jgi:hypothetical protein
MDVRHLIEKWRRRAEVSEDARAKEAYQACADDLANLTAPTIQVTPSSEKAKWIVTDDLEDISGYVYWGEGLFMLSGMSDRDTQDSYSEAIEEVRKRRRERLG